MNKNVAHLGPSLIRRGQTPGVSLTIRTSKVRTIEELAVIGAQNQQSKSIYERQKPRPKGLLGAPRPRAA